MMDGILEYKSNGYMCNISYDATSDGTLKIDSSDSMNEGTNKERNGEKEERGDNENKKKTLASHQKVGLLNDVHNVSLWMMLGCSLQMVM